MIDTGDLVEYRKDGEYRYRGFVTRIYRDENLAVVENQSDDSERKELPLNELVVINV